MVKVICDACGEQINGNMFTLVIHHKDDSEKEGNIDCYCHLCERCAKNVLKLIGKDGGNND